MGSYSGVYVCIPLEVNYWWLPVVFLQFLIVILACFSHCVFLQLVVFRQKFGIYTRVTFGFISTTMLLMLLTSTGAFLFTLANGKMIEDCEISSLEVRKWLLYIHSFGEYFFVICEVLGTIERITTTFSHKVRKSNVFPTIFSAGCLLGTIAAIAYIYFIRISFNKTLLGIGFGSLTLMEVINGAAVFVLWYVAMQKYQKNQDVSLSVRYEFVQSYTYSRCAAASVVARVLLYTYIYLKLAGFFDGGLDEAFFYIMNVFINTYCLIYPWTIMLCHRKIYKQIRGFLETHFTMLRINRVKQDGNKSLYTIDGRQINFEHTTKEHFDQLNRFWKE